MNGQTESLDLGSTVLKLSEDIYSHFQKSSHAIANSAHDTWDSIRKNIENVVETHHGECLFCVDDNEKFYIRAIKQEVTIKDIMLGNVKKVSGYLSYISSVVIVGAAIGTDYYGYNILKILFKGLDTSSLILEIPLAASALIAAKILTSDFGDNLIKSGGYQVIGENRIYVGPK